MAYHLRMNGQGERFNRTVIARLEYYAAECRRDWDIFVQSLRYSYNDQVHPASIFKPFISVQSHQSPGRKTLYVLTALNIDAKVTTSPKALLVRLLHRIATMNKDGDKRVESSERRNKDNHDRKTQNASHPFTAGQYIYLYRPAITTSVADHLADELYNKLMPRRQDRF